MTNKTLLPGLPNFDSLNPKQNTERVADSDRESLAKISTLLENFNWHEKMAIAVYACHSIDSTHNLVTIMPAHGVFCVSIKQALEFVTQLSSSALAKLVTNILEEPFEGEIEVENEAY